MTKRAAVVYLEAARVIAEGDGTHCCIRIRSATAQRYPRTHEDFLPPFAAIFMPRGSHISVAWFGDPIDDRNQNRRVLALCFAAAMAESGDL